ncbi:hypothetical protein AAFC00_000842 [Neodothiora populina]|uniref:Proteophosphoglycan ppg4 n=1 Tax=Neodothiora populina TaxID=2781224 RepID=A0ABR3PLX0_9PEZI
MSAPKPNRDRFSASGSAASSSPRDSSVPLLREDESDSTATPDNTASTSAATGPGKSPATAKQSKRRLFGLGKKKEEPAMNALPPPQTPVMPSTQAAITAMRPVSPPREPLTEVKRIPPVSPTRSLAASPNRGAVRSASPKAPSIASSQIFERSVQESSIPSELSPAIPSHIQTEDYIPAALEASSLAITNDRLDPDDVEIVTHASHHTAAEGIAEGTASAMHSEAALQASPQDSQHESIYSALSRQQESADNDTASTYGALDPNDVKRLSFISFADVVQAEHAETGSLHNMPLSSISLAHGRTRSPPLDRSPSPVRSPGSSHSQSFSQGVITPPIGSHPASMKGLDLSPARSPAIVNSPHQHGELTIETMRQALRRSGSGDLSAAARSGSLPVSAGGVDEGGLERSPFR